MDLLELLGEYLDRFPGILDERSAAESISNDPYLFWMIVIGSAFFVGLSYLLLNPRKRKRPVRIIPNYGPATLPVFEGRVPLVEDGEPGMATFNDVGVYGRMSVSGDVD